MKWRPIIFGGESIQAILDGRKTQTRRVIKPQRLLTCPYGRPGDSLWVRETFKYLDREKTRVCYQATPDACVDGPFIRLGNWTSPIFMPRWASRISLLVTAVRVERLRQMSFKDWIADFYPTDEEVEQARATFTGSAFQREHVQKKWDAINAKRGFRFEDNPWLWVIEFERIRD